MSSPGNSLGITAAGLVKFDGTATFSGVTTTQFDVLVGAASNGISSIGPGSIGQVLQSQGNASNPAYSTATYPSSSGGTGKILYDNGTNFVESVPTFPASASATNRKIIVSDGTNWNASTETWATPGTSGNVLTSDGTNWTSAAAPGGGLLTATVTLTSAQIKALHGTPIQIVAAPGAGKMICLVSGYAKFNYGGNNAFTAGAAQVVDLQLGTNASYYGTGNGIIGNTPLTGTATVLMYNRVFSANTAGVSVANSENQPLNAYNPVATEISGNAAGDNTIQINVLYFIQTI